MLSGVASTRATIDQVQGRSTLKFDFSSADRACFEKSLKVLMLEKLSLVADLQIKFHDLTILLKYEVWKVGVLQKGVFRLQELLCLVRPC